MRVTYFLYYIFINIAETLIRLFPVPAKTGYRKIGSPNKDSPVLLTCNYHLTIHRLRRAMRGVDYHLLIANSKGINVWCAAAGGLLNNHCVISVIKTSGIEDKVEHKKIILPQLAAPGIEASVIKKKTGWRVIWGPIEAKDLPTFLENNFTKTPKMTTVRFPLIERIEMASMWAFLISVILLLIWLPLFLKETPAMLIQVWYLSLVSFLFFPLFEPLLKLKRRIFFVSLGKAIVLTIILAFAAAGITFYILVVTQYSRWLLIRWSIFSTIVVLVIILDLTGATPVLKSDLHEEKTFSISIDLEKCKGTGICIQVCPRDCYELDSVKKKVRMPRADNCVQCGACIVQCPYDALYFENKKGQIITPENVRKFKLNMMGKRDCCLACKITNKLID